jgi:hypothetical protein
MEGCTFSNLQMSTSRRIQFYLVALHYFKFALLVSLDVMCTNYRDFEKYRQGERRENSRIKNSMMASDGRRVGMTKNRSGVWLLRQVLRSFSAVVRGMILLFLPLCVCVLGGVARYGSKRRH